MFAVDRKAEAGTGGRDLWVVYDGECPFCSSYVTLYRIRQQTDHVHLIDARSGHPLVADIRRAGFDLDVGMVVKFEGRFYHGAEAMNVLAILGSGSGFFNRLNRALFRHPRLSRILYPWMVRGRLLVLRMLGRKTIGEVERSTG
jgi:predicted DCC family thiol-disulfide oxidoreductase YuxK